MTTADGSLVGRGFALWREALRWQRVLESAVAPLGLTNTQYLVLSAANDVIRHAGDAVTQRAIARCAGLDETMTSRMVRSLTMRSLLDRGGTFGDQRAFRVIVTSRGEQLLARAKPAVEAASEHFFGERSVS